MPEKRLNVYDKLELSQTAKGGHHQMAFVADPREIMAVSLRRHNDPRRAGVAGLVDPPSS